MSVQGQAPTGQPVPPPAEKKPARRNPILGYIEDSYNGLYKIVIEPSMPTKQTVILLVVGLIVGLIWGWGIRPVEFYDASPNQLSQAAQDQWIKSVAVAHDTQTFYPDDRATALLMVVSDPASAVTRMLLDAGIDPADAAALQSLKPITDQIPASSTPAKVEPRGLVDDIISLLIPIILIVVVTPILVVVWRLLIKDNIVSPIRKQIRMRTDADFRDKTQKEQEEIRRRQEERRLAEILKQQEEEARKKALAEGRVEIPPVMQALYIFNKGRSFDESTEIEVGAAKEFLGQCGAVIAEAVDPDPTAIEVWLFDMFDQVNIKKVIVTETAYGNAATRAAIEDSVENPATDVVVASPGVSVVLETQKLRLQAKIPSVTVSPDGRFENFQMQMKAWDKSQSGQPAPAPVAAAPVSAAAPAPLSFDAPPPPRPVAPAPLPPAPAPTGARPLSSYDDIQFDPPPMSTPRQAPAPLPPAPAPTGARPLSSYDDIQFDPPPAAPLRPAAPPAPAGARPLSSYDDIQFDPPPAAPMSAPRPAPVQPLRPAAPPPAPGFGDEDDPFGNTGDFTPLGKN